MIRSIRATPAPRVRRRSRCDDDGLDVDALEALLARHEIRLLAIQPRLHNPTGRDLVAGAARAAARAGPPPRLLHPRGRDLRRPALRRRGAAPRCAPRRPRTSSTSTRSRRRSAAACGSAGSPPAARCSTGSSPRSAPTTSTARRSPSSPSPATSPPAPTRHRPSGRAAFYRERLDAMPESIERHLGVDRGSTPSRSAAATCGCPSTSTSTSASSPTRPSARASPTSPATRCGSSERPDLNLRLSFGYLEPAEIDEGLRRMASAIRALRRRPARRQAVPV